jgi:imidazolonepropionase-like amidohydrolase
MTRPSLLLSAALALGAAQPALAQGAQYRGTAGTFLFTDCRIETVTQGTLDGASLLVQDGRIAALGTMVGVPPLAERIPCNGGTLYPGLIDGGARIGLGEVESLSETRDEDELGDVTPQMRALTAVNPSSSHIPVTRLSGVTSALVTPTGGLMPGTAALIHLHGYTPDQMSGGAEAVLVNFPTAGRRGARDTRSTDAIEKADREAVEALSELFEQAALYARIDSARAAGADVPQPYQPEMAALLPVVRGQRLLLVEANAARDIVRVLDWLKDRPVRAVLTGAAEGWRVADQIAEAGLPVITGPVLGQPTRGSDRYDRAYTNAALLAQAGVTVALRTLEQENVRNLPFHAGFAAAYGVDYGFDRARALEAVTINPARILGVADRTGSLEVGKDATLFLADGDPFEPATRVSEVLIRGTRLPMVSRQTELFDEYLQREPGLRAGDR